MRKVMIVLFVAAMLLAACGGSSKKSTPFGAQGNTNTTKAGSKDTSSGSGNDEYDALVDKASKARIRVTYKTSGSDQQDEFLTLSQDGNGKVAYFTDDGDSQVIADGDTYTSCSNVKTTPSCTQLTGTTGKAATAGFSALFAGPLGAVAAAKGTGSFADKSSETVAGRDAECVSLDYVGVKWKSCADKETGIFLKWEGSAGGSGSSFAATEVGDPKDSDFTPPATPETVPSIPGYNP